MILKFPIAVAILIVFVSFQSKVCVAKSLVKEEENVKDKLLFILSEAKENTLIKVQKIKMLAATENEKFIARVNEMVEKFDDINMLKKKNNVIVLCDKMRDDIKNAALTIISHLGSCIFEVINAVDADMKFLISEIDLLIKTIQNTENITEELRRKAVDLSKKFPEFDQYVTKLKGCEIQSGVIQFEQQISKAVIACKNSIQINK